jgi:hypothetical protein
LAVEIEHIKNLPRSRRRHIALRARYLVAEFVSRALKRFHINARMTPNITITTHPRTASSISLAGIGAVRRYRGGVVAIPGTAAKANIKVKSQLRMNDLTAG